MISADVPQPSDPPGIALPLQGSVGAGTCSDKSARTALPWHRFVGGGGLSSSWNAVASHCYLMSICKFCWINAVQFVAGPLVNLQRLWITVIANFCHFSIEGSILWVPYYSHSRESWSLNSFLGTIFMGWVRRQTQVWNGIWLFREFRPKKNDFL